jgi:hypothetical protein
VTSPRPAEGAGGSEPGVPSDNTTLSEVLDEFLRSGFAGDVRVSDDGRLCCGVCGYCAAATEVALQEIRRLEGASDPADMVAVLAMTCPACKSDGVAVASYGPEASPGEALVLRELSKV